MQVTSVGQAIVVTEATEEQKQAIAAIAKNKRPQPELLTGREVAAVCHCHPKSVSRWAEDGMIRKIRIGKRKVMYDAAEIAEFAMNGTTPSAATGSVGSTANGQVLENNVAECGHDH